MKNERIKSDKTELLYETDGMITEFEAVVTGYLHDPDSDRDYVILDRTAFFPEGGGQQSDTGEIITGDGKSVRVYDVQSVDDSVRHYIDGTLSENDKITGKIDAPSRFSRMQNHGAEHLLCGLIHSRFGYENVGFHMSDEGVTFDVDGPLTEEDIRNIERLANEAVFKNVPVTVSFPTAEEAMHT
ncbi:MAG: alanyl-tRNA editing protein, partial [Lachnospiraceae bacterium]|nr:alanyl-tRNA editing protein [Lachnospiraceae bacterium]